MKYCSILEGKIIGVPWKMFKYILPIVRATGNPLICIQIPSSEAAGIMGPFIRAQHERGEEAGIQY